MTILEALDEANTNAGITTMVFANIQEFNTFIESFNSSDYPANIITPITSNGVYTKGMRKGVIPLQGWVLRRIPEDGLDVRSVDAEENYIAPMRALAVKFIGKLLQTDIIDPEVENVSDSIRSEYAFLSMHLFGVSYTVNIPTLENVC